jgi:hypothetical protein
LFANYIIETKKFKKGKSYTVLMFKTINELTPHYLRDLFESRSTGYNLRNSEDI